MSEAKFDGETRVQEYLTGAGLRVERFTAPIDLVPADMREVRLKSIWNGRFYALTFRKPALGG